MGAIASQITSPTIVYSTVIQSRIKESIKAPASLAFVQEIHREPDEFLVQMASNAENVSIWWRHHTGSGELDVDADVAVDVDRDRALPWPWWRHQMETFSALLAICAGNSPVTGNKESSTVTSAV